MIAPQKPAQPVATLDWLAAFLVQKVQYDENARLMRYIGAFSNLSDCVAERDRPGQLPHLACVPSGPAGEDT